jgi:hypothetical protein
MSTTTVPLCEVTGEEVADAMRQGLDGNQPALRLQPGARSWGRINPTPSPTWS